MSALVDTSGWPIGHANCAHCGIETSINWNGRCHVCWAPRLIAEPDPLTRMMTRHEAEQADREARLRGIRYVHEGAVLSA